MPEEAIKGKTDWLSPVAIVLGIGGVFTGLYFWIKKPPKEVKEGEWAKAGVILSRKKFEAIITTEQAGWKSAGEELARKPFQITITEVVPGIWLPAHTELAQKTFRVTIAEAPGAKSPEVFTLPAQNITSNGATLRGLLVDTGYVSNVDVYFQFGKTTYYEMGNTPKARSSDEGQSFQADISHLQLNTTYHYRAAADPVGYAPPEVKTTYGAHMTFTTAAEEVKGFTMRVKNPPAGATDWIAGARLGGYLPYLRNRIPIYETWVWEKDVPDYAIDFVLMVVDAAGHALTGKEWIPLRLRDGKDYVFDCVTQQMIET